MKNFITSLLYIIKNWNKLWSKGLTIIGDIKIFKYPLYVQYNPDPDYAITGYDIDKFISLLKPGDIVLHHYNNYLDSFLIPGYYSHSGIYIGNGEVIHAVAEGVSKQHIIDFAMSDGIAIVRPKKGQDTAIVRVKKWIGKSYDFYFNTNDDALYCHELTATAYKELNPEQYPVTWMGIVWKFLGKKYLAESFLNNKNFDTIIEIKK